MVVPGSRDRASDGERVVGRWVGWWHVGGAAAAARAGAELPGRAQPHRRGDAPAALRLRERRALCVPASVFASLIIPTLLYIFSLDLYMLPENNMNCKLTNLLIY